MEFRRQVDAPEWSGSARGAAGGRLEPEASAAPGARAPRGQGQQGGILEKEAPIHVSNVLLFDSKAGRGVRVGSRLTKDGKRERISRATGEPVGKQD